MTDSKKNFLLTILINSAVKAVKGIARLKPETQLKLGKKLGRLLQKLLASHRKYVAVNLNLCFPEASKFYKKTLTDQYFESFGMGILEFCMAGFTPDHKLPPYQISGFEAVEGLLKEKRPVIFVSAHFTTMIIMGRLMSKHFSFGGVFRLQRNNLFNDLFAKYAGDYGVSLISPSLYSIMDHLEKESVIYFIDQDHGPRYSLFAPFFGVKTATIKALPVLSEASKAAIVPVFCYRHLNPLRYELTFLPPLTNYPLQDENENALLLNQIVETAILKQPELYFWYYKRFRTRPKGEVNPYQ